MVNQYKNSPFNVFAAKVDNNDMWLPYYAHAMDTAGVIERLINRWLPAHILEIMSENNPEADWHGLSKFIALTHDIFKMSPVFQSKICNGNAILIERILNAGYELRNISDFLDHKKTPHSFAGEAILIESGCPESVASVIGAHHGIPLASYEAPEDLMEPYEENFFGLEGQSSAEGKKWEETWNDWITVSLELSGYKSVSRLPEINPLAQMILTGLLIMADWIASNPSYAPLIHFEDKGEYIKYPERIDQIWDSIKLPDQWLPNCWFMDDNIFKEKFDFSPNVIQNKMLEIAEETTSPGIYILEAPMGVGKTEAALAASEIFASKWNCEGIFFGLPTQATANGLFARLEHWAKKQSEDVRLSIRLAHGMAKLQKDYRELFHGCARINEDEDNGLIVHEWFEGRKQALLSTFVVGTVDQILMAALKQKHVMFRHLGLAGKVVIVDECHAYDAYMCTYLERALEWLGVYKVPVILLSATLPIKRRIRFIEAYAGKSFIKEADNWRNNRGYPIITYTEGTTVEQSVVPVSDKKKHIKIFRSALTDISQMLKEKLSQGGCVGIVVNTVETAQNIAKQLAEDFKNHEVILIHARYTDSDRQSKENELLKRLGKDSVPNMRNVIVVGTQILEQSLDIDFDLLITEIAPMDLLLQRIGRLHRHGFRKRSPLLENPMCYVCECDEYDKGTQKIYGDWLLKRTAKLLKNEIVLPDDISPLIQETYRELNKDEEFYSFWQEQEKNQKIKESKAKTHRLASESSLNGNIHGLLDSTIVDRELDALARVRDGESSIPVLLMVYEDGYAEFVPWESEGERIPTDHVPSEEECCKILRQKVQLPRILSVYKFDECVDWLESVNKEILGEWQRSRWLHGELILLLHKNLTVDICGFRLSYDEKYGLLCEKEDGE